MPQGMRYMDFDVVLSNINGGTFPNTVIKMKECLTTAYQSELYTVPPLWEWTGRAGHRKKRFKFSCLFNGRRLVVRFYSSHLLPWLSSYAPSFFLTATLLMRHALRIACSQPPSKTLSGEQGDAHCIELLVPWLLDEHRTRLGMALRQNVDQQDGDQSVPPGACNC